MSVLIAAMLLPTASALSISQCGGVMTVSNASYSYPAASCNGPATFTFANDTHNTSLACTDNQVIGGHDTIVVGSGARSDGIYNCTFVGPTIKSGSVSSLYIVGQDVSNFTPEFAGIGSNITVGHYLRVNVFAPFGYNSTSVFGSRVAGFSYIFPLMNNTFNYRDTELQMSAFFGNFTNRLSVLKGQIPFGAYNINESQIFVNVSYAKYGKIEGWKSFAVPQYTISRNKTVNYNPYEIDYSFLAFDQLVMFRLNITANLNLTPMYIQPTYPTFNWNIIPDNGLRSTTIKYIVAIPPQDRNWNFTAYLYRYTPVEFVVNPVSSGIGPHSALYRAFEFPNNNYSKDSNGSLIYFVNYTTPIAIGINSSIMTAQGTIPGSGRFIQDSTTPSFSFGLGYCALPYNSSNPIITVSRSGEYRMVGRLLPLAAPALPQLLNAPCSTGIVISGNDIEINCNNGTINDTVHGIMIENSSNVRLDNCRIYGNGIEINGSTGISLYNTTLTPTAANSSGIAISDAQGVSFFNLSIGNGYRDAFSVFSSSGTPFSEAIQIHNLRMCGADNISAVSHVAFIYSSSSTCPSAIGAVVEFLNLTPYDELAILTIALLLIYAAIALRHSRKGHGRRITKPARSRS